MTCHFVSRHEYKKSSDLEYQGHWLAKYPGAVLIPEGGAGLPALKGIFEVVHELNQQTDYDVLCCAVGSGTTLAGLAIANQNIKTLIGFAALKGGTSLKAQINQLQLQYQQRICDYHLETAFHCGGFGRVTPELAAFTREFVAETGVMIELVYTGKMLLGLKDMIEAGHFEPGTRIVALHTGGLQGLQGLTYRGLFEWSN